MKFNNELSVNPNESNKVNELTEDKEDKLNYEYFCESEETNHLEQLLINSEFIGMKDINNYLDNNSVSQFLSGDIKTLVMYVLKLQKLKAEIKSDLLNMKEFQVERIGREFLSNAYERIYKVQIKNVFACIVGQPNVYHEIKKFLNQKAIYFNDLNKSKLLNVVNSKQETKFNKLIEIHNEHKD